ncbi:NAD(P)-binding protein [Polychaeton citri CBS 116435]|uniref:NAD(P)-binding protein n=1 Tax=Polychaeton citri CBS 116435 TaxID=1314669 RepID=A0A9P4Q3C2_9PEZI|nr:NAD(P)-binding protein [Polychaeton citri CBS 116435]
MEQVPHAHKTALVTGAGSGLGLAIAKVLLAQGANVIAIDIDAKRVEDFKSNVSAAYPECTLPTACDISKEAHLDSVFKEAVDLFGSIDYVVNCAGIIDGFQGVADMDPTLWDRLIAVNLTAPAMIMKRAVSLMLEKGTKGAIVNVSSIAGFRGGSNGAAYTASKHGLLGLTKNTAVNYGPKGIRCNAIMPGSMATNIGDCLQSGFNLEGFQHMRRVVPEDNTMDCDVEKVAKLVSYLLSDAAEPVNGATWTVDGGQTV